MQKIQIKEITPAELKKTFSVTFELTPDVTLGFYYEDWNNDKVKVILDYNLNRTQQTICAQYMSLQTACNRINKMAKTNPAFVYYQIAMNGFNTVVYGKKTAKEIKKNPRKTGKKMAKAYRNML